MDSHRRRFAELELAGSKFPAEADSDQGLQPSSQAANELLWPIPLLKEKPFRPQRLETKHQYCLYVCLFYGGTERMEDVRGDPRWTPPNIPYRRLANGVSATHRALLAGITRRSLHSLRAS
ncbi:hypothetical protein BHE74_00004869 [Ensete ventricosum]|nr:hypothetical protein BHE74_00004869 [Ensete ventricosum]